MEEEGYIRSKFKRLCVFCGSNSGHRKVFSDAALELGNELVCIAYTFLWTRYLFLLFSSFSCLMDIYADYVGLLSFRDEFVGILWGYDMMFDVLYRVKFCLELVVLVGFQITDHYMVCVHINELWIRCLMYLIWSCFHISELWIRCLMYWNGYVLLGKMALYLNFFFQA